METFVITIDGPAGAGKTTVARALAQRINFVLLESGVFYRFITWFLWKRGIEIQDFTSKEELKNYLKSLLSKLEVRLTSSDTKLIFEGRELTEELRRGEVEDRVSIVSAEIAVREVVNEYLRALVKGKKVITEGRDMGTVVFPSAKLKIFLTADLEVRAKRRFQDTKDRDFKEVLRNIHQRDVLDSHRQYAPLRKAEDAIEIDTTNYSVEEVVEQIICLVERAMRCE